jgi:hypothetical protein
METETVRKSVNVALEDLNMGGKRFVVEPAMSSPNAGTFQIRFLDDSGDGKALVVDLSDSGEEEAVLRIREQLEVFFAV